MSHNANYGLVEPFDIDNGELDGFSPQECFVFGVEWRMFQIELEATDNTFTFQCHSANAVRFEAMCKRHHREIKVCWLHEDYPEWSVLHVGAKE